MKIGTCPRPCHAMHPESGGGAVVTLLLHPGALACLACPATWESEADYRAECEPQQLALSVSTSPNTKEPRC